MTDNTLVQVALEVDLSNKECARAIQIYFSFGFVCKCIVLTEKNISAHPASPFLLDSFTQSNLGH